jgi:hypothetical protein
MCFWRATLPEPVTLVLLMFATAGWCLRRGAPHRKSKETYQSVKLVDN